MKQLYILDFRIEHAQKLVFDENIEGIAYDKEFIRDCRENRNGGPAYTLMFEKIPVVCGGVRIFWPGSGQAWALVTSDIKNYCRAHFLVRQKLDEIIEDNDLDRVQAHVRADVPIFSRYAEYYGFKLECECKKYGPDRRDFYLYARVRT